LRNDIQTQLLRKAKFLGLEENKLWKKL
jgi:hypothetical protein